MTAAPPPGQPGPQPPGYPPQPPGPPGPPPPRQTYWTQPSGGAKPAQTGTRILLIFGGGFLLLVLLAAVAVVALAPRPTPAICPDPNQVCDGPPIEPPPISGASPTPQPAINTPGPSQPAPTPAPTGAAPTPAPTDGSQPPAVVVAPQLPNADSPALRDGELYTSSRWGYALQHPDYWQVEELADGGFTLAAGFRSTDAQVNVRFDAADAATTSPTQMLAQLEERYAGRIQSLALETSDANRALRPSIGHVPGLARTYRGTLGADGGILPVSLVLISASDGRLTMAVTVFTTRPDATFDDGTRVFRAAGFLVDPLLKRIDWQAAE